MVARHGIAEGCGGEKIDTQERNVGVADKITEPNGIRATIGPEHGGFAQDGQPKDEYAEHARRDGERHENILSLSAMGRLAHR